MNQEDHNRLQHELLMGDVYCYSEDRSTIEHEIRMGATYESLVRDGFIKIARRIYAKGL